MAHDDTRPPSPSTPAPKGEPGIRADVSANGASVSPSGSDAPVRPAGFDEDMIRKYPRSNRKLTLAVSTYALATDPSIDNQTQTIHISPHGMEFHTQRDYPAGTLLKIHVALPDYWQRKQKFVEYRRIDTPDKFKMLCKVVRVEDVGKRGKKKLIVAQTVNIDEVDEAVLKAWLQDG
jgi:hypothetical protein